MTSADIIQSQADKIQLLEAELHTFQKRCDQYAQAYDQLQQQLKDLLRHRFGKKSERFVEDDLHLQQLLFGPSKDAADTAPSSVTACETAATPTVTPPPRKKREPSNKDLPRRIEIISVSEADRQCVCGCQKKVIRYEIKELLHRQAAVLEMIEQRREVVACEQGCEGALKTAPAPRHILPKAKVSEEFLAFLIVSKLDDRQPLYHLEKQLAQRYGLDCSGQTMARWLIDLKPALQPLYNLYKDQVIDYDVGSCDATSLQVLREPGRSPETKSSVYCTRGGPPGKAVILYDYNASGHKHFIQEWFTGFSGFLHVDGEQCFEGLSDTVQLSNCNAHARRKFEPIAQSAKGKGLAKEALRFFKALYNIERQAKDQGLCPEKRYELRQRDAKPLLEKFKQWLDEYSVTVLLQSPLGKAMQYCLKLWPGLTRYLADGRLEIDNNLTEQEIKPLVIARKNFLFCASVAGAEALCLHFSVIRTAKCHGWDPYAYYVQVLKQIPHCQTVEDYEALLPWNLSVKLAKAA